jgi:hypothetical protein
MSVPRRKNVVVRLTRNTWTRCVGFVKKSDKLTKIQIRNEQIKSRKRQFGLEYLTLLRENASDDQLMISLHSALSRIDALEDDIRRLRETATAINAATKSKIIRKHSSHLVPSIVVTDEETTRSRPQTASYSAAYSARDLNSYAWVVHPSAPSEEQLKGI